MATIALLKQKGGCGASTLAVNLAGELTVREYAGDSDSAKEFAALADAVEGLLP